MYTGTCFVHWVREVMLDLPFTRHTLFGEVLKLFSNGFSICQIWPLRFFSHSCPRSALLKELHSAASFPKWVWTGEICVPYAVRNFRGNFQWWRKRKTYRTGTCLPVCENVVYVHHFTGYFFIIWGKHLPCISKGLLGSWVYCKCQFIF